MSPDRLSVWGSSAARAHTDSARIRFRRALTLSAMTLVMPGSAQLVMGNKRVGRVAIRVWCGAIAIFVCVVLLGMISRTSLFSLLTNAFLTSAFRWFLIVGALAWVGLLLDAWRLGAPFELHRRHRLVMTGLNATLCCVTAGALLFGAHILSVQSNFIGAVFAAETVSKPVDGRYNILLLGGDSGKDRFGLRPDSLTVASVDADTGRTVLIGLPRNLEDVPFPDGSVMDQQWPDGFTCATCELNAINTWAEGHAELFDVQNPGLVATEAAVEEITGLSVNYYAMINMRGFSKLVDAVGGVTINVKNRTPIGGVDEPIRGWIPEGKQKLNGFETLWYARSRVKSDDWSRMGRQKCVMNAMLQQLSPQKVMLNVEQIADSGKSLLETNIPAQDLDVLMDLALKARNQKVSTVSLVPPVIYTGNPDFDKVRHIIDKAIDKAEGGDTAKDEQKPSTKGQAGAGAATTSGDGANADDPREANSAESLSKVC